MHYLVYPAIIVVCWLPELTVKMLLSAGLEESQLLSSILLNLYLLQGFFDAIIYGVIPRLKDYCKSGKKQIMPQEADSLSIITLNTNDNPLAHGLYGTALSLPNELQIFEKNCTDEKLH